MASMMAAGGAWPAPHTQAVGAPDRALFCKGLAKGCTAAHLQAAFSTYGTIVDCQIARHRSGRSAGFAIVTFAHHEEALQAMQAVDNAFFMGRRLSVKWFSPERAMEGSVQGTGMPYMIPALNPSQLDLLMQALQLMMDTPNVPAQNQHISAWLDDYNMAQRESPLAPLGHDLMQQPTPVDVLNLSALSLADLPGPVPGAGSRPGAATPTSLDVPDGAVFITAGAVRNADKAGKPDGLAESRLSKWCSAPGSAVAASTAPSTVDDAEAASETASLHASDDSSVATSGQLPALPCDLSTSTTPKSDPVSVTAPVPSTSTSTIGPDSLDPPEAFLSRMHPTGPIGPIRAGASSEPGSFTSTSISTASAAQQAPLFPGAPSLAPLRTNGLAPHPQLPRTAPAAPSRAAGPMGGFSSCGGGVSPDALRLQQALAEQAACSAQQQYMEALAKMAAAREQMAAAASLMGQHGGVLPPAGLPPRAQRMAPGMPAAPMMGPMGPMGPMGQPFPADLNSLLMLQNAGGMGRPFF